MCVVFNRVQSKTQMRLFWFTEVSLSLRGQPPCLAQGEPQANQVLHPQSFVEHGGL